MSAHVYYRKNKGPFGTGESLAQRYGNVLQRTLELCNTKDGERSVTALNAKLNSLLARSPGAMERVGAAHAIQTRDVGPGDNTGTPILANLSVAYASGEMIGLELLPIAPVPQITGDYVKYPRRDRMQMIRGEGRGPRGASNEVPMNEETGSYATTAHSHDGHVGLDAVIAGLIPRDAPIDRFANMVDNVSFHHQLEHEVKAVETLTTVGNYGTDYKLALTSGVHWDESGAQIAKNIFDAKRKIWNGQGKSDLIAAMSGPIWDVLRQTPSLLGVQASTDRGFITEEQFADFFGFDGVMISDLRTDAANLGQTEDPQFTWGNNFMITRVSRTPQLKNAAWGYTMRWAANGMVAGDAAAVAGMVANKGVFTRLWFDPAHAPFGAFKFRKADYWGIEIVAADTGFLFSDVLATFPS